MILFLMMFPAFTKDVEATQHILANLPPPMRAAMGLSFKNFFTVYGFFGYLFTFITLAGAIQATNLGVGVISKEESGKTADFLLSKPISRFKIITSKILAILTMVLITNIIFTTVAVITARIVVVGDFDQILFAMLSATLLFVQLLFMFLGILLSVILKKVKSVAAVSLPIVFGFFITGMLGALFGIDEIKYISPFKFFEPTYIINNYAYDPKFLIIGGLFIIIATIASYVIFIKKDIKAGA